MGKKASLSEVERAKIVTLHEEGYSERQISKRLAHSKTAVHEAIKKFQNYGMYSDKVRTGRPRKTSKRDDVLMRRIVTRSPMSSCRKIRAELLHSGTDISLKTISRRLVHDFGLASYKPAQKPRLTNNMKKKRLAFAKKYESWGEEEWGKVLFSDESSVQQFVVRKRHVRRPSGKRFVERFTIPTVKHPPSQMVWGSMSKYGTAGLYFLPVGTTMNGEKYLNLLKNHLDIPNGSHGCTVFMHDGAPCHRAAHVRTYLKMRKIDVLDWPGNSPDLNPIENLWHIMKNKVADYQPTSAQELQKAIRMVWANDITQDLCCKLIESMPRRMKMVIKNQGGHTKY